MLEILHGPPYQVRRVQRKKPNRQFQSAKKDTPCLDSVTLYLNSIGDTPFLTREQEVKLGQDRVRAEEEILQFVQSVQGLGASFLYLQCLFKAYTYRATLRKKVLQQSIKQLLCGYAPSIVVDPVIAECLGSRLKYWRPMAIDRCKKLLGKIRTAIASSDDSSSIQFFRDEFLWDRFPEDFSQKKEAMFIEITFLQAGIDSYWQAVNGLVGSNLRLVVGVADKFSRGRLKPEFISLGNLGLVAAAERYDPTKGMKFSTYATPWIRRAIREGIRGDRTIGIPESKAVLISKVKRTAAKLSHILGRVPYAVEIADSLKVSEDTIEEILELMESPLSLDYEISKDGTTFGEFVEDTNSRSPIKTLAEDEIRQGVRKAILQLPLRDQIVLCRRWGISLDSLEDGEEESGPQIGEALGISRERVRKIGNWAQKKFRVRVFNLRPLL